MDVANDRSSHQVATPRSGGVAIVATFLIGFLLIYFLGDETLISNKYMLSFLFSSLSVAAISFLDDLKGKKVVVKLTVMVVAILIIMDGGVVINELAIPWIGLVKTGWIAYPLTFFWILGLTNAVNFMDGLDGLIGCTAAFVSLFFMIITFSQGSIFVYITCYTILAGVVGFLFWNFPLAKIFMGDVGSVFLGFVFASLAIIAARYDHSHTSFLVMPLLLFHVIFDTLVTFIRRCLRRENVFHAHRSHLYQLMHQLGYSHLQVTLLQCGFCFLQGLGALWMVRICGDQRLFVFLPFFILQIIYASIIFQKAKSRNLI